MASRILVAAFLCLTLAGRLSGQDKAPDMQEMMKKWQEAMTPGKPHAQLAEMVGAWDVETKMWMGGPGTEPSVTKGSARMSMILGGRFLQQETTGEAMGMPMNGLGITGYDNFKKKYVGFWIDNTGTAMFTMEGEMDAEGKTCTYWGEMDEPTTGERGKKVKYTVTFDGPDQHTFRIYDVAAYGDATPTMEMVYQRAKKSK